MIRSKPVIIGALFFPLVALVLMTAFRSAGLRSGNEITLPIQGYDPRDLLSGHYLRYRVDYGVTNICASEGAETYVCLDTRLASPYRPESCEIFIKGFCNHGVFEAGIERFYVPESDASRLEKDVQSKSASILVTVSSSGSAQIKSLLIDGIPWK